MMALADVLAARSDNARATARIECGSLGEVTLEALSIRELEQLSRSEDADRAVFYAACRDLQRVGAELQRQGKVYRPDQVTELVSADEANIAAQAVRVLSGWTAEEEPSAQADKAAETAANAVDTGESGQDSHESAAESGSSASADAGDSADAPQPAAGAKDVLSFRKKKVHPLNPERKGVSADLEDGAVDDCKSWAVDDTFSEGDRWRCREESAEALPVADAARRFRGSGGRIAREDGQGDQCRDGEQERSVPEGNEATAIAGAGAAVSGSSASADAGESAGRIAREDGQGDQCRDGEEERSVPEGNEATPIAGTGAAEDGQGAEERDMSEVRPEVVQEIAEVRHDTVQQELTGNGEIRLSSVQTGGEKVGDGQASREFLTDRTNKTAKSDKEQVLWSETGQTPQNVVEMDKMDSGLRNNGLVADNKSAHRRRKKPNRVHENKSAFGAATGSAVHESESEWTRAEVRIMHEIESEIAEKVHETESENGKKAHESKSDFAEKVHENKSEKKKKVHETESEIAERVARELLEGLRRAAWVR